MIAKYGDAAAKSGAIIVNMSGFDSIPADLGTFFLLKHARSAYGLRISEVDGIMTGSGNVSGGTIASALNMMRTPGAEKEGSDPFCMFPRAEAVAAGTEPSSIVAPTPDFRALPFWEPSTQSYGAAFVMATINARVVRRSAGLYALQGAKLKNNPAALPSLPSSSSNGSSPKGIDARYSIAPFRYNEYMGLKSYAAALGLNLAMGAMSLLGKLPALIGWVQPWLPQPGDGPSEEARNRAHFDYFLVGHTEPPAPSSSSSNSSKRRRIVACVSGGDGGYTETAKMICEAGMALATQRTSLPGHALGGGFLTPAAAFGSILVDRLHAQGMTFRIVKDEEV